MSALLLAGLLAITPLPVSSSAAQPADTFEIVLPRYPQVERRSSVRLDADRLVVPPQYGLVELRKGSLLVGLFQVHQIVLVANRSLRGSHTFTVQTAQDSFTISADRMEPGPYNGVVLFWVGEELAAVVQPSQVLLITEEDARIGLELSGSADRGGG